MISTSTDLENIRLLTPVRTKPTINRLASVEEELSDRIEREPNGKRILPLCRKLSVLLLDRSPDFDGEVRDTLRGGLIKNLNCSGRQANCLIELALELAHARRYGSYRSPDVDLRFLVCTATNATIDFGSN